MILIIIFIVMSILVIIGLILAHKSDIVFSPLTISDEDLILLNVTTTCANMVAMM